MDSPWCDPDRAVSRRLTWWLVLRVFAQGPLGQPEERVTAFRYDAQGFLEQIEDPEARIVDFTRDLAGRVDLQTLPFVNPTPPHDPPGGTELIDFGYDANGNVMGITPPR